MYGSDGAREGTPSFSIIVPTYGRPTQLKECLQGLARLNYPKKSLEIIVVDDGTPISYKRIVRPFEKDINVVLHRQSHAGPATARNRVVFPEPDGPSNTSTGAALESQRRSARTVGPPT